MRLAATLAVGAWVVVAGLAVLRIGSGWLALAGLVAVGFTALAAAHWLVFMRRSAAALRTVRDPQGQAVSWGRRDFFVAMSKLAVFALIGPGMLLSARSQGQTTQPADPCAGKHDANHRFQVTTCVNTHNKKPEKVAENTTQGNARKAAQTFADTACKARDNCGANECKRAGQGYTLEFVECVPSNAVECQKNHQGYSCTWRVTSVSCRCA
jgi:hypothetical protein